MLFSKVVMIDVRSWCMGGVFVCLLPGPGAGARSAMCCVVVGRAKLYFNSLLMRTVETPSSQSD